MGRRRSAGRERWSRVAFVVVRASQQVIVTLMLFLTALEPSRRYTSRQRASSALASVPSRTWNHRPYGSLGTYIRVECKSVQAGGNAWPWATQKCWHLVSWITDIRRSRMPGDRRCQPRPRSARGAGTGLDLTLGPGSDFGCSAPILASARTPQPRAHRYNVSTPPSAQRGVSIHPGAVPA